MPRPSDKATFYDVVTIQLEGHKDCDASFDVEVKFTATRGRAGHPNDPDTIAPEIEIVAIRPYTTGIVEATGRRSTKRDYLEAPKWLSDILRDCIDIDALIADWNDVDE